MSGRPSGIVERLLAERIGLDSSSVGEGLIARGVHARMMALGLRSEVDYDRALLEQVEEVLALVEEVVVPESWFFRDDRPFEILEHFARAGWLIGPDRLPLAILSLPCAGGEEPYSIAMTLLEGGLPADRFRIDAVDISTRAVSRAIAGVYGSNSFRGSSRLPHSTYFREQNGSFTVDLAVRSTVRFHQGNLLDPTLFADRPPFDVVFCRNVLIYFDDHARRRAFATLARLVVDGGLLFLGHADRMDQPEGSPFEMTEDKGGFAYRKGRLKAKPVKAPRDVRVPLECGSLLPLSKPGASSRTPKNVGELREPEKKAVKSTPVEPPALTLDRAMSLADLGRYDEATVLVEGVIRDVGANARGYFLLGLIAQAAGSRDQAEAYYLKTIYLDAQHDEALLGLAMLARRKGDLVAEAAYRRRAERVLARKAVS
jgi:chemotaxis protein methyltransferase WspC